MKNKRAGLKIKAVILIVTIMSVISGITVNAANTTTKKKAKFSFVKYSETFLGYRVTGEYLFELPVLKGHSKAIKKINASLTKVYKNSMPSRNALKGYTESRNTQATYSDRYYYKTTCKATYNKHGIVSFCFQMEWYAGGVFNSKHYGATYNLKTGKKLALYDVISGTRSDVKEKIASKMARKYATGYSPYYTYADTKQKIKTMKWSSFGFYLKNKKVIVSTGSYGPLGGNGEVPFKFKGNY